MSRAAATLALFGLVSGCGRGAEPAPPCTLAGNGDTAHVFAITHRLTIDDAKDPQAFADSFRRHVAALEECESTRRPNLLLFPEDSGLVAWFVGRQGLLGRNAPDSATAFNALYAQAHLASDAYRRRFPGISSARALTLALSDRAWRAMDQTFGTIAKEANAWVVSSANLPRSARVDDADFRDPDATGLAYVASGAEVFNTALVYSPTGERVGQVDKVYLTDPEEQTLELSNGSLQTLPVISLPFVKLGIATSRDAFYPPLAQRLDNLGAELVVQPEAFSGWSQSEKPGDWLPDVMLSAGWSLNQKYASVKHVAAPMLTGNLFELTFDGQAFISAHATPTDTPRGFVASTPVPGMLTVGPWAFPETEATAPLADRRDAVREQGKDLLPGTHSGSEGLTYDGVIGAELHFDGEGRPASKSVGATTSVAVAPAAQGHQRNPAVAWGGDSNAYVAWTDGRPGAARIWLSRSSDDGKTWVEATAADPELSASRQLRPAIAAGDNGFVAVAWQDDGPGTEQIRWAVSEDGARTFVGGWAERSPAAQWEPAIVALPGNGWAIAWTDFRTGLAPQIRVRCFTSATAGAAASRAVDPSNQAAPRAEGSQLQPTLARLDDQLFAGWIDYRRRDWQVRGRAGALCSEDGKSLELSSPSNTEVLAADPVAAVAPNGQLLLAWDEIRDRQGHRQIAAAELTHGVWQNLDSSARDGISRFRPSPFWLGGFKLAIQDLSPSKSALAILEQGRDPARLDDSGNAPNQLTRPRAATRPDGVAALIVFEDDRDGWVRVRAQALKNGL